MIKYLSKNNLDIKKYDACISNATNSRIYAFSWYLNCVTDNWDALVYDDYEAVMPLPTRKKYGINYIYLPPWVQQLGVFSKEKISKELVNDFIKNIPRKFKRVAIYLNSANQLDIKNIEIRNNYILNLNSSYDEIKSGFTKGRRSSIKQARQFYLKIENSDELDILIDLFIGEKDKTITKNFDFEKLRILKDNLLLLSKLKIYHVKSADNELIGGAVFLFDEYRITYLFSTINKKGKEQQAMSFLIDYIIESYSNSKYIFDFEGSMIMNLASFFMSFGSKKEMYYHFNQKRIF